MALTDTEKAKIFQIFGVPKLGTAVIVDDLTHRGPSMAEAWEATYTTGTFTNVITAINARLTAVSADTDVSARASALVTEWDTITQGSPLRITRSATGADGVIADDERKRENIRQALGNVIGLWVPKGGFVALTEREFGKAYAGDR